MPPTRNRQLPGDERGRLVTALIVIAHGSPYAEANRDIEEVVTRIRERRGFQHVALAYLDLNDPDIPTAVEACLRAGATKIFAVPYFLHAGRHVALDIPEILQRATATRNVEVFLGRYIGATEQIVEVVRARIEAAL